MLRVFLNGWTLGHQGYRGEECIIFFRVIMKNVKYNNLGITEESTGGCFPLRMRDFVHFEKQSAKTHWRERN